MEVSIEALVDRIFNHLQHGGSVVGAKRRPGISAEEAGVALDKLDLEFPSELTRLYAYCDGTSITEGEEIGKTLLFPGFYWMSLNHAIDVYHGVSKSEAWNHSWFPIFANGGGDFYSVICDSSSPYFGEVVGFILGEPSHIIEFGGIKAMFATIDRSYEDGAFFFCDGKLKADYRKMRLIARQIQPSFMEHDA